MLHIRKVIQKVSEKDSKEFIFWLKQNDAEKLAQLFSLMQKSELDESAIAIELLATPSAFYALKSRLNGKIQEFFAHNIPDSNIDLLRNVANIPNLLFNSPREIAIAHLLKMEKELIEHDMPYALTTVYSALKKLNRYSQKYFDYSEQYNKHIAYTIAIDKAKELLSDFNKILGEFLMSRDEDQLKILGLIRQEMHNYANLYESHRLLVYRNILDVEFELFIGVAPGNESEINLDEILAKTENILNSYRNDPSYCFLLTILNFLWFQYYHQHQLHKKATCYFTLVNEKTPILLLNNFFCFPSLFLLSKAERYLANNEEQKLYEESKLLSASFTPDVSDAPNYINYFKFQAIAAFYSKRYNESVALLNDLLNAVSFRNFYHAEVEIKLFLSLSYLLANKSEMAGAMVKNVQRKLRDTDSQSYDNARTFAKMLSVMLSPNGKVDAGKCLKLRDVFKAQNVGSTKILPYICLDDLFLKSLLKRERHAL